MLSKEMHREKESSQPMQTGIEEAIMQLKVHQFAHALHLQGTQYLVHHLTLLLMLPDLPQLSVIMNNIASSVNRESIWNIKKSNKSIRNNMRLLKSVKISAKELLQLTEPKSNLIN